MNHADTRAKTKRAVCERGLRPSARRRPAMRPRAPRPTIRQPRRGHQPAVASAAAQTARRRPRGRAFYQHRVASLAHTMPRRCSTATHNINRANKPTPCLSTNATPFLRPPPTSS
uniref:Uncharacterized protein n=1 Tax=Plectus sambesii TaxID=2011161 RepID=A0A914VXX8_9BILA